MPSNPFLPGIGTDYLNAHPSAAFAAFFGNQLAGQNQGFARWLQSQQDPYLQSYGAAAAANPNLTYLQFLGTQNPLARFNTLSPSTRGENWGLQAPKVGYNYGVGF